MNEMVEHARNIAQAVDIPVLADGDTGYGNPLNIRRTVSEYERPASAPSSSRTRSSPSGAGTCSAAR